MLDYKDDGSGEEDELSAVPAAGPKYRSAAYRVRRVDGDDAVDGGQG